MDLDKALDILFLGMVIGACFAVAMLRKLGYRKQPDTEASRNAPADSQQNLK